jgi:TatD DNase family protein
MYINLHSHGPDAADITVVNALVNQSTFTTLYSCGLHPWYLQNAKLDIELLQKIAVQQNCIAVGECGLDKKCNTNFEQQLLYFKQQILLANAIQKPIIIHCVKAQSEVITCLKQMQNKVPIIIHGFYQNKNVLANWLQENYYISIGAAVINKDSNAQQALLQIPLSKLFLETDDAPISISKVYQQTASILQLSKTELQQQICTNFNTIFGNIYK